VCSIYSVQHTPFCCCVMQCRPLDDRAAGQVKHSPRLTCVRYAVCSGPRQFHAYLQGECCGNDEPICSLDKNVFCFASLM